MTQILVMHISQTHIIRFQVVLQSHTTPSGVYCSRFLWMPGGSEFQPRTA